MGRLIAQPVLDDGRLRDEAAPVTAPAAVPSPSSWPKTPRGELRVVPRQASEAPLRSPRLPRVDADPMISGPHAAPFSLIDGQVEYSEEGEKLHDLPQSGWSAERRSSREPSWPNGGRERHVSAPMGWPEAPPPAGPALGPHFSGFLSGAAERGAATNRGRPPAPEWTVSIDNRWPDLPDDASAMVLEEGTLFEAWDRLRWLEEEQRSI